MKILLGLTAIIPALGMVAGLSNSLTITAFLIILLTQVKKPVTLPLKSVKLELLWSSWCCLTCLWSGHFMASWAAYVKVFTLLSLGLINYNGWQAPKKLVEYALILGICLAIGLFFVEYLSGGFLSLSYRQIFQPASVPLFYLHMLDRGCALLSLLAWVVMGILIKYHRYLLAGAVYVIIGSLLMISDSLASFVGFIGGGLIFVLCRLLTVKLLKFITSLLILGSLLVPVLAYNLNPSRLAGSFDSALPISAIHRLFIWHFVTDQASSKLWLGWGFDASKQFVVNDEQIVKYKTHHLFPLPLHPHNNILQIWFETGLIGLLLFLLIVYKFTNNLQQIIIIERGKSRSQSLNFGVVAYACLVNYHIIGMISYGVWQSWWIASGVFTALLLKYLLKPETSEQKLVIDRPAQSFKPHNHYAGLSR